MTAPRLQRQQGAVLLLLFLVLFVAASTMVLSALNNRNPALQRQADVRQEMLRAKEALLAYAAMYPDYTAGGARLLPCPDTANTAGTPAASCSLSTVGRLPRFELLAAGNPYPFNGTYAGIDEQFWYAASEDFAFSVDGETGIAAVIIAPGPALATQTRPHTSAARYLEAGNVTGPNFVNAYAVDPAAFNDRVLAIRSAELLSLVTARIVPVIKTRMDAYHGVHATYPADAAVLATAMAGQAWFAADAWLAGGDITYTLLTADTATLVFTGCGITFTLSHGGNVAQDSSSC